VKCRLHGATGKKKFSDFNVCIVVEWRVPGRDNAARNEAKCHRHFAAYEAAKVTEVASSSGLASSSSSQPLPPGVPQLPSPIVSPQPTSTSLTHFTSLGLTPLESTPPEPTPHEPTPEPTPCKPTPKPTPEPALCEPTPILSKSALPLSTLAPISQEEPLHSPSLIVSLSPDSYFLELEDIEKGDQTKSVTIPTIQSSLPPQALPHPAEEIFPSASVLDRGQTLPVNHVGQFQTKTYSHPST
jgi:hypothetical protein